MSPRALLTVRDLPLYGQTPKETPMPFRPSTTVHVSPHTTEPEREAFAFINGDPTALGYETLAGAPRATGGPHAPAHEVASIVVRLRDGGEHELHVAPEDVVVADTSYDAGLVTPNYDYEPHPSACSRPVSVDPSTTLRIYARARHAHASPGTAVSTYKAPTGTTGPKTTEEPARPLVSDWTFTHGKVSVVVALPMGDTLRMREALVADPADDVLTREMTRAALTAALARIDEPAAAAA